MRTLSIAILVLCVAGCSGTATIIKKDGSFVEAKIVRSDETSIIIELEESVEKVISRGEISEIDHPGDVSATVGITLGVAVTPFAIIYTHSASYFEPIALVAAAAWLADVSFIAYGIWGVVVWNKSTSAASQAGGSKGPKVIPVALTDGERNYYGLGLGWSW